MYSDTEFDEHLNEFDPDQNYYENNFSDLHNFSKYLSIDEFLESNSFNLTNINSLSIFCQNIRSFSNLDNFMCCFPHDKMPDVFIFSETWHDENKPINIPGYSDYHTVRSGRAGGVSIFVKSRISSCIIDKFSFANDSIEICTVKISNSSEFMYISGIYRPVSDNIDNFTTALETIFADPMFHCASNVIGGDLNVNLMSEVGAVGRMVDVMRSHHFLQTILSSTRPGHHSSPSTLIDHLWINKLCGYNSGVVETGISDHHGIYIVLPFQVDKKSSQLVEITFRDHSDNHQLTFQTLLSNYNWDTLKSNDINLYANNFVSTLNEIYRKSFPLKTKFVSLKFFKNPWHTDEIKKLTNARNNYHKLFQAQLVTKTEYSLFRNKITSLIRKSKENYYQNLFNRNSGNIKKTWKLINKICNRGQNKSLEKIIHNDTTITDPLQIAETFNNFFVNIADNLASNLPVSTERREPL